MIDNFASWNLTISFNIYRHHILLWFILVSWLSYFIIFPYYLYFLFPMLKPFIVSQNPWIIAIYFFTFLFKGYLYFVENNNALNLVIYYFLTATDMLVIQLTINLIYLHCQSHKTHSTYVDSVGWWNQKNIR